jgi:DMATS type aromatic prenyltransferase
MSNPLDVSSTTVARFGLFYAPDQVYHQFLFDRWMDICHGLRLQVDNSQTRTVIDELRGILRPWGARPIGDSCAPPSFVSADGFPAEISLSWKHRQPELRILFESFGPEATTRGCQDAGQSLTHRLAGKPGVSIHRYLAVEDLFLTVDPQPYRPTVWHSLAWQPGRPLRYKVYLNPQAHGADRSYEVVDAAMDRLHLAPAWQPVRRRARELAQRGHELEFFALDLDSTPTARVKIYFRHQAGIAMGEIDHVASFAKRHDPRRAERARRVIYDRDDNGEVITNEPMTCLAFRQDTEGPDEANLYLRLPENVQSDAEASARITELMRLEEIDPQPYADVLAQLAPAPSETIVGLQELVSYRTTKPDQPADVGLYFRFSTYASPAEVSA